MDSDSHGIDVTNETRWSDTKYPPGLVSVFTAELSRFKDFLASYRSLWLPKDAGEWIQTGPYINENRNQAVAVLDKYPHFEWLFMLDDDHKFGSDMLLKQLDVFYTGNFDVLGMIYLKRQPPYPPVGALFHTRDVLMGRTCDHLDRGLNMGDCLPCTSRIKLRAITWDDTPQYAAIWQSPDLCLGGAGLLIHRRVFEKITRPIFQVGRIQPDLVLEDIFFSIRCQLAGLKMGMDLDHCLGHTGLMTWWPRRDKTRGTWAVAFDQPVMSPLGDQPRPEQDRPAGKIILG